MSNICAYVYNENNTALHFCCRNSFGNSFLFSVFTLMHLVEGSVALQDFSSYMSWNWTAVPPSCQPITYHFPPSVLTPTCFVSLVLYFIPCAS